MFKQVINTVIGMVKLFKQRPKVTDVLNHLLLVTPTLVAEITEFIGMDKKGKLDESLEGLDAYTGSDEGAIDLLRDIPPDKEEEFFDHFKEMIRILGYNKIQVPGYFIGNGDVQKQ